MPNKSTEPLLAGFEPPAPGQWRAEAEKLLKGAPFEKKMLTPLPEGITLQPIYDQAPDLFKRDLPGQGTRVRSGNPAGYLAQPWRISQELPYGSPEEFNAVARHDSERGQTEIHLILDAAGRAGRDPDQAESGEVGACGTSISAVTDLALALKDLDWSKLSLCVAPGANGLALGILLIAWGRMHRIDLARLRGAFLFDPIADGARSGQLAAPVNTLFDEMAVLVRAFSGNVPGMRALAADATVVHEAGGHGVQELAYGLAAAVLTLRELSRRGIDLEVAVRSIRFVFSIGPNFFAEICKLRAARILWSRVLEACEIDPATVPMEIHARTALRNKTRLDAHTNMLRTTTEAMSAVLGGCTSLHVGPYDEVFQVPDTFSRRIARNTQIILSEECGLTRVIDPAGGSWFVESLTAEMAERAWAKFQEMERQGGLWAVLREGSFQKEVMASAEERNKALGTRRETMIGVNNFPNPKDEFGPARIPDYRAMREKRARDIARHRISAEQHIDQAVLTALGRVTDAPLEYRFEAAVEAAKNGATLGELTKALRAGGTKGETLEAMPMRRIAAHYEEIRFAAAAAEAAGRLPRVLQLNLGPSRNYRARADWTSNFFQVAGLSVDAARDFADPASAVAAAREAGAQVVVLCGTEETYAAQAVELARALKALAPVPLVILAGSPGDQEAAWREAGIDEFIHVRVPHYAFVSRLLKQLGVL